MTSISKATGVPAARTFAFASLLSCLGTLASGCGGSNGVGRDTAGTVGTPDAGDLATVTVDITSRFQTMEGFGGALAFYVNYLTDHPNRAEIYDLVFRDLGLDILRIGNWYQDRVVEKAAVAAVAAATASLGHPPRLLMSSWSPPASLKSNGDTKNGGTLTQTDGVYAYDEFGQWWADALQAYAALGVRPDFISIQNEPDFTALWSTCLFGPTEGIDAAHGIGVAGYDQALDAVYSHVQALAPVPLLLGPEISGIGGKKLQNYLGRMNPDHFAVVAHHLYNGGMPTAPETYNVAMRIAAGLAPDKPLFMTEFAPMPQDMFATAWLMNNAVTVEGVSAYIYWDLTWDAPGGLVTTENPYDRSSWKTDKGYAVRDPYYAVKHFARWVDYGWTRVAATASTTAVKVSAFVSPDGSQTTVVLLNAGATARDVTLTTGDWTYAKSDVFRTSSSADLTERTAELGPLAVGGVITLPPLGIATITLTE